MSDADDVLDVLGGRLRDKARLVDATRVQDDLRAKSDEWDGAEEVQRWRRRRRSS